jgi:cohesin complex subunit SCC1
MPSFFLTGADKILQDAQAPQRILALLLLGIVKIYFKKVQYVYYDCNTIFHSLGMRHSAEPSTSTGSSMQVKKAVHIGRQKDTNKVKKSIHAVRITEISGSMSNEGFLVMTEAEINVQRPVVVPAFSIPTRFELDSFDLGIAEDM